MRRRRREFGQLEIDPVVAKVSFVVIVVVVVVVRNDLVRVDGQLRGKQRSPRLDQLEQLEERHRRLMNVRRSL